MSRPQDRWPDFTEAVRARLEKGRAEYGDRSFTRSPGDLMVELQQEVLDLAGWGFVLWHRLEAMRSALNGADPRTPEPVTAPPELLTAGQVAERLRLPRARVYALARAGRIGGAVRIGSQVRFEAQALEAWIRDGGSER